MSLTGDCQIDDECMAEMLSVRKQQITSEYEYASNNRQGACNNVDDNLSQVGTCWIDIHCR